jgi:hypothetical protein
MFDRSASEKQMGTLTGGLVDFILNEKGAGNSSCDAPPPSIVPSTSVKCRYRVSVGIRAFGIISAIFLCLRTIIKICARLPIKG